MYLSIPTGGVSKPRTYRIIFPLHRPLIGTWLYLHTTLRQEGGGGGSVEKSFNQTVSTLYTITDVFQVNFKVLGSFKKQKMCFGMNNGPLKWRTEHKSQQLGASSCYYCFIAAVVARSGDCVWCRHSSIDTRSQIHERTISFRFLAIILKVIRGFRIQCVHHKPVSSHFCSNYVQ